MSKEAKSSALGSLQAARKDATRDKVLEAMATITSELEANGIYPHNEGKITVTEVARRAEVGATTLRNSHHRETRDQVKEWLAGLGKKRTKRGARTAATEKIQWYEDALRKANAEVMKLEAEVLEMRINGNGGNVVDIGPKRNR